MEGQYTFFLIHGCHEQGFSSQSGVDIIIWLQNARWLKAPVIFQVIRSWEFYRGDRKRVVHGVTARSYCGVKLQLLIGTKNGSCLSFEGCRCRSKNECRFHYIFKMGMVLAARSNRTVGQFCVEHVEAITVQDLPYFCQGTRNPF